MALSRINELSAVCQFSNRNNLLIAGVWLASAMSAQAQDAGVIQQNLQKEIDQRRLALPPVSSPAKKEQDTRTNEAQQAKLLVKKFKITGLSLITQDEALAVIKDKVNQELTFDQLQAAGHAVADLYTAIGRLATAVIPEQDVEDGVLEIRIIEARVGAISIQGTEDNASLRLKPQVAKTYIENGNAADQFLNLAKLNRSKALLNDLPGVDAQVALVKSTQEGRSDIQVTLNEGALFNGRGDVSNSGSPSTGILQNIWSLNLNDPLGLGDLATMDFALSQGSTYATLKYWFPLGTDGWRIAPSVSNLRYHSLSSFAATQSTGTANVMGLYASYALLRDAADVQTLNLSAETKNYQNLTNATETSAYNIAKANAGISGSWMGLKQYLSYALTAGMGRLAINNAAQLTADQSQSGAQTDGGFFKLSMNVSLNTNLPLKNTSARFNFNGQLANKNLNSSEQLYLGGPDSVRAYPVAQGGGSQGYVASVEVTRNFEQGMQLGAFLDVGVIQQYKTNWSTALQGSTKADNFYSLKATGLSVKYAWNKVQLQAALAYRLGDNPLHTSTGAQLNADNAYRKVQSWVKGIYAFN